MRSGRMFGVNDMRCVDTPVPAIEDQRTVMVKTSMASICGSDLHLVCHGAGVGHALPCPHGYPGHESIGEVVESHDPSIETGTRVLCFPNPPVAEGFSEFQRIGPSYLLPLPDVDATTVSDGELLMAQQLGTVIFAARQKPIDVVGKTVLIMGQGSAGLFWSYWLKRQGATRVIVSDLCADRLAASPAFGADITINAAEDDVRAAIRDLTGAGPDYVVEAVGRSETLYQSIELVKPGGDLMWFGLPDSDDSVPISFAKFFRKKLSASSTYGAQDEGDAVSFRTALDLIAGGHIDVTPLLSHVYSIDDIDQAFATANDPGPGGALKVSLTF